jgi:hypothetical protein
MRAPRTYLVPSTMRAMRVLEFLAHSKRPLAQTPKSRGLRQPEGRCGKIGL